MGADSMDMCVKNVPKISPHELFRSHSDCACARKVNQQLNSYIKSNVYFYSHDTVLVK